MKRAVIYARVSTEEQAREGVSLDTQVEECRKYASANGFLVVKEYKEEYSGTLLDRPKLNDLLYMARSGEVDAVLVLKTDRFSREPMDALPLYHAFNRMGVELHTVQGRVENSPEGELMLTMFTAFGKFERSQIAERSRRNKLEAAQRGQVMAGSSPYGYTFKKGAGKFEINEVEAYWVRQIFEWYTGREMLSINDLLRRLVAAGAPTRAGGGRWHAESVRIILRSETYCGVWHWNKRMSVPPKARRDIDRALKTSNVLHDRSDWIAIPIPAIIDRSIWEAAQARMQENVLRSKRNSKHNYLLGGGGGHIWCAECCRKYGGRSRKVGGREFLTYDCSGKNVTRTRAGGGPARCSSKNLHAARLEEFVWEYISSVLTDPDALRDLARRTKDEEEAEGRDLEVLEELVREGEALDREEDKLVGLWLAGKISNPEIYDKRSEAIKERRRGLAATQAEVERRAKERWLKVADELAVKELVEEARERLPALSFEEKKDVLRALDLRVVVFPDYFTVTGIVTPRVVPPLTINEVQGSGMVERAGVGVGTYDETAGPGPDLEEVKGPGMIVTMDRSSGGEARALARISTSLVQTGQRTRRGNVRKAGEKVSVKSSADQAHAPRTTRRTTPWTAPPARHK